MCAHTSSASAHIIRVHKSKQTLSLLFIEVLRCVRKRHPPSASFIRTTRIIILIKIIHQITEYVCKNPHLYNVCPSQYNVAKITTNTWVSDALEPDFDVSCQCNTYLLLCFIVLNI